ncbi:MAG: hypothetical protein Q8K60_06995 [Parachlamydiaceae bacterium]|nr:hypothetical protein [Parachlamydiaceae bacterium]
MKNKLFKISSICLLMGVCSFGLFKFYDYLTDDFRMGNIHHEFPEDFPFESFWQPVNTTDEEKNHLTYILDQPFHYLGKGAQSYVFSSEDDKYVIKFFKFKNLRPTLFVNLIPPVFPFLEFKNTCIERRQKRLMNVFIGYDLAYKVVKNETQLVYVHLTPTNFFKKNVTVTDKIGRTWHINLDDVYFVLQKKGEVLSSRLSRLLERGNIQKVKSTISTLLGMYVSEYRQGMFDMDHGVTHNTGFIDDGINGDQAFHLDVGQLCRTEKIKNVEYYKHDLQIVIWRINKWLVDHFPQYHSEIPQFLENEYLKWTGEELHIGAINPKFSKKNLP